MATTFIDYTGDGNATKSFSFPSIQVSDVKVEVDEVVKTSGVHYNITSYTTTGGGNVVFTSGNIPSSPAAIRIFRDTDVDNPKATYTAGSSIKAADLNDNQEQILFASQEEQNQSIITSRIKDGAVTTAKIKDDAITGAKIADDQINSEHYLDGSIDTSHIADLNVTTAKLANNAVTSAKLANNSVGTTALAAGAVTATELATGSVTAAKILDGNVTTAKLAADAVTGAKIADDQINSEHYVDGSIDTAHIADAQVTTAKIADASVTTAKLAEDAVNGSKIADDSINSEHYVDGSIDTAHIANSQVTTAKIADANITAAKIATNAVTTDKIADGELTTLAGMQSTTASNLASSTALTATTAELNQLDGITLETSVTTNSDTRIPTSKAVNDLVLSVTNALGGFVAIANETSFPTTNPDPSNNAGTVVSISQLASGLAVNSSGVATITNGAGTGNTVTITGFPSSLHSQTLPASSGLNVQTTSTLHTYTFHKQLASAADIQAISATVNSFSNRYRVSASAPTSSLDGGDLWYDTTNSKLMVYSSQNSAWEESTAIGNFFISTVSSSSATGGGSATPNGTAYRFTISNAPTSAQQLLVSVDGVIQKPNSGSSQPSEGYVLVGNDIIFGAAPANGASLFVTALGSAVGIGTPSNNTVTTAILQNGSVTTAKIVDANVTTAKITDANVTTAKIANNAVTTAKITDANVTTAKLADSAVTTAKIANNAVTLGKLFQGTTAGFIATSNGSNCTVPTYPSYNGDTFIIHDLQCNQDSSNNNPVIGAAGGGTSLTFRTNQNGASGSAVASILDLTGLQLGRMSQYVKLAAPTDQSGQASYTFTFPPISGTNGQALTTNGSGTTSWTSINTDLVNDTSPQLGGTLDTNSQNIHFNDSSEARFGSAANGDMAILHDGTDSIIDNQTGNLFLRSGSTHLQSLTGENKIVAEADGKVELYCDNSKKLSTESYGVSLHGLTLTSQNHLLYYNSSTGQVSYEAPPTSGIPASGGTFTGDISVSGGAGAITVTANSDIRLANGTWTGNSAGKIQHHDNALYLQGGTNGLRFREDGTDRWYIDGSGHFHPASNNAYDIGNTSYRVRNIYTNDLHLSNEGSSNDVDGSWGDWTIQEGESDLFLKNNRSGKKYKFNLTEVS